MVVLKKHKLANRGYSREITSFADIGFSSFFSISATFIDVSVERLAHKTSKVKCTFSTIPRDDGIMGFVYHLQLSPRPNVSIFHKALPAVGSSLKLHRRGEAAAVLILQ
jgi:hypothetical protein